jgi:hypothetical protein
MTDAHAYRDECTERTERLLDSRLAGIVADLTSMVARAERSALTSSLPGAETDLDRDIRG